MEKRHNYVRKAAELATQFYINPATNQPNVTGLILAGSADFKTELSQSNMFDHRLKGKILKVVDVSNGGEDGFNQAIKLPAEKLGNVKFMQEIHISRDSGKYVVGLDDTLKVLETGAVETLIVWENLHLTSLEFVTNKSHEGSQFCRGFGGIGAILRYKLDVRDFDEEEVYEDSDDVDEVHEDSE
ncbi:Eukaryotic peptide chain release factor subunit 1-3 [Capsicum chinense]|nr:Eukaryotic peptide chain release factor subunit 1-3 [Capsicum chinense]